MKALQNRPVITKYKSHKGACVGPKQRVGRPTDHGSIPAGARDISEKFRPAVGSALPPIQKEPWFFPRGKAVGVWRWPLTTTYCQGQELTELRLHSLHSCMACIWITVPLHLIPQISLHKQAALQSNVFSDFIGFASWHVGYLSILQLLQASGEKCLKSELQVKVAVVCLAYLFHIPKIPVFNLGPRDYLCNLSVIAAFTAPKVETASCHLLSTSPFTIIPQFDAYIVVKYLKNKFAVVQNLMLYRKRTRFKHKGCVKI